MRRSIHLLLAAALALLLAGCGGEPASPSPSPTPEQTAPPAEELVFSLAYDPGASLHPITGTSQVNLDLAPLIYQGLYELDNQFQAQPALAASASASQDSLVWTVTLKEGVQFSDGTPLTAAHVAASLNAARTSGLYASRLSSVTAVAEGEEGTVVITLSAPNGNLPALLDIPVVLEQGGGTPLGTGPYRLADREGTLVLETNPNVQLEGALPFEEIQLYQVSTADARIAAFDSGSVSAVTTDFTSPYALGYSGSYETWDFPTTSMVYVGFRTTGGACASPAVRQALSAAFDRVSVVRSLLSGHGDAAALPLSPLHGDYDQDGADSLDYDVERAAQLLAEAGYETGEDGMLYRGRTRLALTLVVNNDSTAKVAVADYLASGLEGMGIEVTVKKLSWEDYTAALSAGNFDLYLGEVRLTGDFDLTALVSGGLNYGGYSGAGLTQALSQWRGAQGAARSRAAQAFFETFAQEVPFAPLCFKRGSLLVRWGMVTDLEPTRANPFYRMEHWTVVSEPTA